MRFFLPLTLLLGHLGLVFSEAEQAPLIRHRDAGRNVSEALFAELEELARVVDISYCVGRTSLGITKPFHCLSRCSDFPAFELVTTWVTELDSCGYIALDHGKKRIVLAFRGTYSVANTITDLSTVPQEYVPYPGSDDADGVSSDILGGIGGLPKRGITMEQPVKCTNCTVHMGFHTSWLNTRKTILPSLQQQLLLYPDYRLNLVGHSLGGAVAALGALDLRARGFDPIITTFGEPRVGNAGLADFIDDRFQLTNDRPDMQDDTKLKYRRVTRVNDPVPLLPLTEWSYAMHAGEIFISKLSLPPDIQDLQHCRGDNDPECIAGQDSSVQGKTVARRSENDLLASVQHELHDVKHEPWGTPSRYKLWQLFFAHRDYFWRLGLCVPGASPLGDGKKFEESDESDSND